MENALTGRGLALRALPWTLLAVFVVAVSLHGTPHGVSATLQFQGWFLVAVALPGTLLGRLLLGSRGVLEDVGVGIALGMAVTLLAWMPLAHWGVVPLLWALPVGVLAAFALVPSWRRHWRAAAPTPLAIHWLLALGVALASFVDSRRIWSDGLGSPVTYKDMWFHDSLVEEALRGFPLQVPQVSGVHLEYHWFANAFMAAAHTLSGAPVEDVLTQQWPMAMLLALTLGVVSLARRAGARWSVTLVAVVAAVLFPASIRVGMWGAGLAMNALIVASPSNTLGAVVLLAIGVVCVGLLRGDLPGRVPAAVALVVLIAAASGSKPSVIPIALGGCLLAGLGALLSKQRGPVVAMGLVTLGLGVAGALLAPVVSTSGNNGSVPQLFSSLYLIPGFSDAAHVPQLAPGHGPLIGVPHLLDPVTGAATLAALGLLLVLDLPRAISVLGLASARVRARPEAWWFAGATAAAYAAVLAISHPAYGQLYFLRTLYPVGVVGSCLALQALLTDRPRGWRPVWLTLLLGGAGFWVTASLVRPGTSAFPDLLRTTGLFVAAMVGVVAVVAVAVRRTPWRAPVSALLVAVSLGAGIGCNLVAARSAFRGHTAAAADPADHYYVDPLERSAAVWLRAHSAADDVVATNVFCTPPRMRLATTHDGACNADAFWVGALTGRRTYLSGWAYTPLASDRWGKLGQVNRKAPWPDRFALSMAAVQHPTPEVRQRLRAAGVRWLFADERATPLSPRIGVLGRVVHRNALVTVVDLDAAPARVAR